MDPRDAGCKCDVSGMKFYTVNDSKEKKRKSFITESNRDTVSDLGLVNKNWFADLKRSYSKSSFVLSTPLLGRVLPERNDIIARPLHSLGEELVTPYHREEKFEQEFSTPGDVRLTLSQSRAILSSQCDSPRLPYSWSPNLSLSLGNSPAVGVGMRQSDSKSSSLSSLATSLGVNLEESMLTWTCSLETPPCQTPGRDTTDMGQCHSVIKPDLYGVSHSKRLSRALFSPGTPGEDWDEGNEYLDNTVETLVEGDKSDGALTPRVINSMVGDLTTEDTDPARSPANGNLREVSVEDVLSDFFYTPSSQLESRRKQAPQRRGVKRKAVPVPYVTEEPGDSAGTITPKRITPSTSPSQLQSILSSEKKVKTAGRNKRVWFADEARSETNSASSKCADGAGENYFSNISARNVNTNDRALFQTDTCSEMRKCAVSELNFAEDCSSSSRSGRMTVGFKCDRRKVETVPDDMFSQMTEEALEDMCQVADSDCVGTELKNTEMEKQNEPETKFTKKSQGHMTFKSEPNPMGILADVQAKCDNSSSKDEYLFTQISPNSLGSILEVTKTYEGTPLSRRKIRRLSGEPPVSLDSLKTAKDMSTNKRMNANKISVSQSVETSVKSAGKNKIKRFLYPSAKQISTTCPKAIFSFGKLFSPSVKITTIKDSVQHVRVLSPVTISQADTSTASSEQLSTTPSSGHPRGKMSLANSFSAGPKSARTPTSNSDFKCFTELLQDCQQGLLDSSFDDDESNCPGKYGNTAETTEVQKNKESNIEVSMTDSNMSKVEFQDTEETSVMQGFSSGSGRMITLSHTSIMKARKLLDSFEAGPAIALDGPPFSEFTTCSAAGMVSPDFRRQTSIRTMCTQSDFTSANVSETAREVDEPFQAYKICDNQETVETKPQDRMHVSHNPITKAELDVPKKENSWKDFCSAGKEQTTGGFHTAGGKSVQLSKTSLQRAQAIIAECLLGEDSHEKPDSKLSASTEDPLYNTSSSRGNIGTFGGFQTARGKDLHVSSASLAKANALISEVPTASVIGHQLNSPPAKRVRLSGPDFEIMQSDPTTIVDCSQGLYIAQTTLGHNILEPESKSSTCVRVNSILTKAVKISGPDLDLSHPNAQNSFGGFHTAGGKGVKVSQSGIAKARELLQEAENEAGSDNQTSRKPDFPLLRLDSPVTSTPQKNSPWKTSLNSLAANMSPVVNSNIPKGFRPFKPPRITPMKENNRIKSATNHWPSPTISNLPEAKHINNMSSPLLDSKSSANLSRHVRPLLTLHEGPKKAAKPDRAVVSEVTREATSETDLSGDKGFDDSIADEDLCAHISAFTQDASNLFSDHGRSSGLHQTPAKEDLLNIVHSPKAVSSSSVHSSDAETPQKVPVKTINIIPPNLNADVGVDFQHKPIQQSVLADKRSNTTDARIRPVNSNCGYSSRVNVIGASIFQTASGKEVSISEAAIEQARKAVGCLDADMFAEDIIEETNPVPQRPVNCQYQKEHVHTRSFSEQSVYMASKSQMAAKDFMITSNISYDQRKVSDELCPDHTSTSTNVGNEKSLFQTASGRVVKVSRQSLEQARRTITADCREESSESTIDSSKLEKTASLMMGESRNCVENSSLANLGSKVSNMSSVPNGQTGNPTGLFQTASGKSLSVSQDALLNARKTLGEDVLAELSRSFDEPNSGSKKNVREEKMGNLSDCLFQTASGKEVPVSVEALKLARQTMGSFSNDDTFDTDLEKLPSEMKKALSVRSPGRSVQISETEAVTSERSRENAGPRVNIHVKVDEEIAFKEYKVEEMLANELGTVKLSKCVFHSTGQPVSISRKVLEEAQKTIGVGEESCQKPMSTDSDAVLPSNYIHQSRNSTEPAVGEDEGQVSSGGSLFQTASGKAVDVSKKALQQARSMINQMDSGQTECDNQMTGQQDTSFHKVSSNTSMKNQAATEMDTSNLVMKLFQTTSGKNVSISDKALGEVKSSNRKFEDEVCLKLKENATKPCNVDVHNNDLFQTASGSSVSITEKALTEVRSIKCKSECEISDKAVEIISNVMKPNSVGKAASVDKGSAGSLFQTASGRTVTISARVLVDARRSINDIESCDSGIEISSNTFSAANLFQTASGRSVNVSAKALAEARKSIGEDNKERISWEKCKDSSNEVLLNTVLAPSLFQTASGKSVKVSAEALADARKSVNVAKESDQEMIKDERSSRHFNKEIPRKINDPAASSKGVTVSGKALAEAWKLINFAHESEQEVRKHRLEHGSSRDSTNSIPSYTVAGTSLFQTASGRSVDISAKALTETRMSIDDAERILQKENNDQEKHYDSLKKKPNATNLFQTASGRSVNVSANALAEVRKSIDTVQYFEQEIGSDQGTFNQIPSCAVSAESLFLTAGNSTVEVSTQALTDARTSMNEAQETKTTNCAENGTNACVDLFQTASGRSVTVSAQALADARISVASNERILLGEHEVHAAIQSVLDDDSPFESNRDDTPFESNRDDTPSEHLVSRNVDAWKTHPKHQTAVKPSLSADPSENRFRNNAFFSPDQNAPKRHNLINDKGTRERRDGCVGDQNQADQGGTKPEQMDSTDHPLSYLSTGIADLKLTLVSNFSLVGNRPSRIDRAAMIYKRKPRFSTPEASVRDVVTRRGHSFKPMTSLEEPERTIPGEDAVTGLAGGDNVDQKTIKHVHIPFQPITSHVSSFKTPYKTSAIDSSSHHPSPIASSNGEPPCINSCELPEKRQVFNPFLHGHGEKFIPGKFEPMLTSPNCPETVSSPVGSPGHVPTFTGDNTADWANNASKLTHLQNETSIGQVPQHTSKLTHLPNETSIGQVPQHTSKLTHLQNDTSIGQVPQHTSKLTHLQNDTSIGQVPQHTSKLTHLQNETSIGQVPQHTSKLTHLQNDTSIGQVPQHTSKLTHLQNDTSIGQVPQHTSKLTHLQNETSIGQVPQHTSKLTHLQNDTSIGQVPQHTSKLTHLQNDTSIGQVPQHTSLPIHEELIARLQTARLRQDKIISHKKRRTVRPGAGRLWKLRSTVPKYDRLQLGDVLDAGTAFHHNRRQVDKKPSDLPSFSSSICSETAEDFRFTLSNHYGSELCAQADGVLVGDGIKLLPDDDGTAGKAEFYRAFLTHENVDPKLITEAWLYNHYRWIVWKLAAYEAFSPQVCAGRCLSPDEVILQLKYRYDREIDNCQRPALRKILERDDTPSKRMVLCVSRILQNQTSDKDTTTQVRLELTDGWYSVQTALDKPLTHLVRTHRLGVGDKICLCGAELVGGEDACSPLDAPSSLHLKVSANSVRKARWDAKLGFQRDPRPMCLSLSSVFGNGGVIPAIDAVVVRIYPKMFMEKLPEGSSVFRDQRAEQKAEETYRQKEQRMMEQLYNKLQTELEAEDFKSSKGLRARTRRSRRLTGAQMELLMTGQEIYEAICSSLEPEAVEACLHSNQQRMLQEFRQRMVDQKRQKFETEFHNALKEKQEQQPQRNVVPLVKLRIAGCHSKDVDAKLNCLLTIWRPNENVLSLFVEGKKLRMFSLSANSCRSRLTNCEVQLTATRGTRYMELPTDENFLDLVYEPREVLTVRDMLSHTPMYEEVDFVGIVIRIENSHLPSDRYLQTVYACDTDFGIVAIRVWSGLKAVHCEEVLIQGKSFLGSNLLYRGRRWRQIVTLDMSLEISLFTQNPTKRTFLQRLSLAQTKTKDKAFMRQAEESLSLMLNGAPQFGDENATPKASRQARAPMTPHGELCLRPELTPIPPQTPETEPSQEVMAKKTVLQTKCAMLARYTNAPPLSPLPSTVPKTVRKAFRPPRRTTDTTPT